MNKTNLQKPSRTNWARVDTLKDSEIDYSDIPGLQDDFFKNAVLKMPERKVLVTLRLDRGVLEWFKKQGPRYQTRINALLRYYVETKKAGKGHKKERNDDRIARHHRLT